MVGGMAVASNAELAEKITFLQNAVGGIAGPFDSFLALRGLKTLPCACVRRAKARCRSPAGSRSIRASRKVLYPGLPSHPQHALAKRQMQTGYGGIVSICGQGRIRRGAANAGALPLFTLAESLGGVESLVDHPGLMTHASVPPDTRKTLGIDDSLIRLSVGIEDLEDLVADLKEALSG